MNMDNLIYDFNTHGLYYENEDMSVPVFSLAIETIEMVFELRTGKLVKIQGYFPLIKAITCSISLPEWVEKEYVLKDIDLSVFKQYEVYDLIQKIPQLRKYFEKVQIRYDKEKGIIQVGNEMQKDEAGIKVNDNILCGLDRHSDLKCIFIIPTKFVR